MIAADVLRLFKLFGARDKLGRTPLQIGKKYCDPDTPLDSTGLDHCKLCTYCWNGKE